MRIDGGPTLAEAGVPATYKPPSQTATLAGTSSQKSSNKSSANATDSAKTASSQTEGDQSSPERPESFALSPPYPNPSSGQVTVRYALPEKSPVRIVLFDALGRQVRALASGRQPIGTHRLTFDAAELSSGTYFIRMSAGKHFTETQAVAMVK